MPSVGLAWFLFRTCVGIFFSCILGFVSWVMVRFVMHSFFLVTPLFDEVMNVLTIGLGAALGASSSSWMLELTRRQLIVRTTTGVTAGILGAWAGLEYGRGVYIMAGMPGIPELGNLVWGALIGSNAVPIIFDLIEIMRRRRF